jgi:hypothetical protein
MEKSIKSSAINYGLYLGGLLTLMTAVLYAVKLELLVNFWLRLVILPILMIVFGVISTAKSKSLLDGFINFKQAFSSYFITVAVGILISTLVSILLFNFIDPDAAIKLKEIAIENTIAMLEGFNAPPEQIAKSVEQIEQQDTQSISAQIFSVAQALVFFAVIGLIVAAIMKKSNPDA